MIKRLICFFVGHGPLNHLRQLSARTSWVECRRCGHAHMRVHK